MNCNLLPLTKAPLGNIICEKLDFGKGNDMTSVSAVLEMAMLLCFGISWPVNISKLIRSKSTKGASILFYFLIWLGYIAGVTSKLITIFTNDAPWYVSVKWYVMAVYVINLIMLTVGITVWFCIRSKEKKSQ